MSKNIQASQMHNVERIKIERRVHEADESPTGEEYWVTDIILYLDNKTCIRYSLFSDHNSIPIDIDPTG